VHAFSPYLSSLNGVGHAPLEKHGKGLSGYITTNNKENFANVMPSCGGHLLYVPFAATMHLK